MVCRVQCRGAGLANFGVFTVNSFYRKQSNFARIFQNGSYNVWEVPIFALIGVLGGLTGALFNAMNAVLARMRKK